MHGNRREGDEMNSARHLRNVTRGGLFRSNGISRMALREQVIPYHQNVHMSAQKTFDGLGRRAYDRFIVIERGIEDGGNASERGELADQSPIPRISPLLDGLHAAGAIHVRGGGQGLALFRSEEHTSEL